VSITTVEFLPFGLDWTHVAWTHVAEIRFTENKDLPDNNDPPRRQKMRNSTVEHISDSKMYQQLTNLLGMML
jgi:hypothetical protein